MSNEIGRMSGKVDKLSFPWIVMEWKIGD